MENKKPTNAQLQRKIRNAVVFVPKDKDTKSVFFSDKGVRLTVTMEEAVIETGYHKHVFFWMTQGGVCQPFLYTKRVIELAIENEAGCIEDGGYSFEKLKKHLEDAGDKAMSNMLEYYGWYLSNIFYPLYSIGTSNAETFFVYNDYIHHFATQSVLMSEHVEDMTNKKFVEKECAMMQEIVNGGHEMVIYPKKTDEELIKENMDALQEEANDGEK